MMLRFGNISVARACVLFSVFVVTAAASGTDVTIRHAPYVVSTVSSKTERGDAPCKYCSATIRYDRTFKWDVYNHVWTETTDREKIPQVCRKCQQAEKEQEKLDKEERRLDQKIEKLETKNRLKAKRRQLSRLRNAGR